jgi:2',3'-cyclic-nucleotide 2'-phosphodiesterase/3'-nucleotidase
VGRNAAPLLRGSDGESPLGDFVTDAMRKAVPADIALQNSGGLRADLPAGAVTRGRLYEVMPFDNTIVEMVLSGRQVKQVLEEGLAQDLVTQVSGLRYRMDMTRAPGGRVAELLDERGQPLEPERDYRVICNNFMAGGGDYYVTLTRGRDMRDTGVTVRGALEEFVTALERQGRPISYRLEGRIARVR